MVVDIVVMGAVMAAAAAAASATAESAATPIATATGGDGGRYNDDNIVRCPMKFKMKYGVVEIRTNEYKQNLDIIKRLTGVRPY